MDELNMYYIEVDVNLVRLTFAIIAEDGHKAVEKVLKYGTRPIMKSGPYSLSNFWVHI